MFASVFVPGVPIPKARPRFRKLPNGAVTTYTPKETQNSEQFVAECIRTAYPNFKPYGGPIHVGMIFHMPIPKSKKLVYHNVDSNCVSNSNEFFIFDNSEMLDSVYKPCRKCRPGKEIAYIPTYPTTRPDIDNMMKLQLDGIQRSGIILDDKQVISIKVKKIYSDTPGVFLEMRFGGKI